jgi:flagellar motor switch protein FliN
MAESTPEESAAASVDAVGELLAEAASLESPAEVEATTAPPQPPPGNAGPTSTGGLPPHAYSLLRIGVPVAVTLAAQRKSVQEIIELGPGAIIKFDKTCDEPLELCVGGHPIATGQVVKIGDKFGLRVSKLTKVSAE